MKNGSVISFHSNFDPKILGDWKHAITKPLHYGIQEITGSEFHHVGIYCDGYYYEAIGKDGVRKIGFEQKKQEIDSCVDIHIFKPCVELNKDEVEIMTNDLDGEVGKKYSAIQAFTSILTAIIFLNLGKIKTKKQFCSKLVFYAFRNLYPKKLNHILPRTVNPEESLKILKRFKIIKERSHVIYGR